MRIIRWTVPILVALLIVATSFSVAHSAPVDNMQILREKLRADKKLVVAVNMQLTQSEAKAFWPVYGLYQKDLAGLMGRVSKLIETYAQNFKTMTDDVAKGMMDEWLAIQAAKLKLQRSYLPEFRKFLPEVKVLRYYQTENKIEAVVRYELAGIIPLAN